MITQGYDGIVRSNGLYGMAFGVSEHADWEQIKRGRLVYWLEQRPWLINYNIPQSDIETVSAFDLLDAEWNLLSNLIFARYLVFPLERIRIYEMTWLYLGDYMWYCAEFDEPWNPMFPPENRWGRGVPNIRRQWKRPMPHLKEKNPNAYADHKKRVQALKSQYGKVWGRNPGNERHGNILQYN